MASNFKMCVVLSLIIAQVAGPTAAWSRDFGGGGIYKEEVTSPESGESDACVDLIWAGVGEGGSGSASHFTSRFVEQNETPYYDLLAKSYDERGLLGRRWDPEQDEKIRRIKELVLRTIKDLVKKNQKAALKHASKQLKLLPFLRLKCPSCYEKFLKFQTAHKIGKEIARGIGNSVAVAAEAAKYHAALQAAHNKYTSDMNAASRRFANCMAQADAVCSREFGNDAPAKAECLSEKINGVGTEPPSCTDIYNDQVAFIEAELANALATATARYTADALTTLLSPIYQLGVACFDYLAPDIWEFFTEDPPSPGEWRDNPKRPIGSVSD
jgi:hypothetical protein